MSQTKKTILHADQKKCVPTVSVLLTKFLLVTLKIYVNDAKCTALFKGQLAHSGAFLPGQESIYPNSSVMGS